MGGNPRDNPAVGVSTVPAQRVTGSPRVIRPAYPNLAALPQALLSHIRRKLHCLLQYLSERQRLTLVIPSEWCAGEMSGLIFPACLEQKMPECRGQLRALSERRA